jgi:hypothetical protein
MGGLGVSLIVGDINATEDAKKSLGELAERLRTQKPTSEAVPEQVNETTNGSPEKKEETVLEAKTNLEAKETPENKEADDSEDEPKEEVKKWLKPLIETEQIFMRIVTEESESEPGTRTINTQAMMILETLAFYVPLNIRPYLEYLEFCQIDAKKLIALFTSKEVGENVENLRKHIANGLKRIEKDVKLSESSKSLLVCDRKQFEKIFLENCVTYLEENDRMKKKRLEIAIELRDAPNDKAKEMIQKIRKIMAEKCAGCTGCTGCTEVHLRVKCAL